MEIIPVSKYATRLIFTLEVEHALEEYILRFIKLHFGLTLKYDQISY